MLQEIERKIRTLRRSLHSAVERVEVDKDVADSFELVCDHLPDTLICVHEILELAFA